MSESLLTEALWFSLRVTVRCADPEFVHPSAYDRWAGLGPTTYACLRASVKFLEAALPEIFIIGKHPS